MSSLFPTNTFVIPLLKYIHSTRLDFQTLPGVTLNCRHT